MDEITASKISQVMQAVQYHTMSRTTDVMAENMAILMSALPPAVSASIGGSSVSVGGSSAPAHRVDFSV